MSLLKNAASKVFASAAAFVMMLSVSPCVSAADTHLSRTSVEADVGESVPVKLLDASGKIKWAVSDPEIITYSKGKVVALSEGKAYLYAINDGKKYKCVVKVSSPDDTVKADVSSITIKKGTVGKVRIFTAGKSVSVKCNGPDIVSMSCESLIDNRFYLNLKGRKAGSCTVTVFNKKDTSESFSIKVKVTNSSSAFSGSTVSVGKDEDDTQTSAAEMSQDEYVDEVIRLVNIERESMGLDPLTKNDKLCEAAGIRVKELSKKFSHTRPDGTQWHTVFKELDITGYKGENLAKGHRTPEEVVKGWMKSERHKENILNDGFTEIGVAYDSSSKCWVQEFLG